MYFAFTTSYYMVVEPFLVAFFVFWREGHSHDGVGLQNNNSEYCN